MSEMTFARTAGSIRTARTLPHGGLGVGTPVLAQQGAVAVETVAPGDRLITRNGARTVVAVEIGILPATVLVYLPKGALGRDCPQSDLVLAPGQPVLTQDRRGRVVMAQSLTGGDPVPSGVRTDHRPDHRLVTLHFAEDQVIYAAGLELECNAATPGA